MCRVAAVDLIAYKLRALFSSFILVNKNLLFPTYPLIVSLPFIVMPSCVE